MNNKKFFLLLMSLFLIMLGSCKPGASLCPASWDYCEPIDVCHNGYIYACTNYSGTSGGYKINNSCYKCIDIDYDCEAAAEAAAYDCYEYKIENSKGTDEVIEYSETDNDLINDKIKSLKDLFLNN